MTILIIISSLVFTLLLFVGIPVIITNKYKKIQHFITLKKIKIFSVFAFFYVLIFDATDGILVTTSYLHSLAYAFGYVYLGAFFISWPVSFILKYFYINFSENVKYSYFYALILVMVISTFAKF
tara:strand:+ start:954 stop:1325 length:372 start_codon:yes stop_codon:yes gene_type:complete